MELASSNRMALRLATRMRSFMMMALAQPLVSISEFLALGEKRYQVQAEGEGYLGGCLCAGSKDFAL